MHVFDLVVVGAGGGPSEVNLSGYLLKVHDTSWSDGIVGIEAGSGLGALKRILQESPDLFSPTAGEPGPTAAQIYSYLRTYLITHAHLDHVLSLVLLAGSAEGPRKNIRGSRQCLEDLQTVFKPSRIWPNLASWDPDDSDHLYLYDPLPDDTEVYTLLNVGLSVRMLPLSHGAEYASSAFFVRHDTSKREFLFFGDVEPDKLAALPGIADVWRAVAPKIAAKKLDAIFIECSWPVGRPDDMLYGHLCPEHLVSELEALAAVVVAWRSTSTVPSFKISTANYSAASPVLSSRKRASSTASPERKRAKHSQDVSVAGELHDALAGLRVYITHCKEDMEDKYTGRPMHIVISEQVNSLLEEKGLGVIVLAAEQGTLIHI